MPVLKHLKNVIIPQNKHTAGLVVMPLAVPDRVYISLNQGMCPPAVPCVKPGDYVRVGQLIADGIGPMSTPIHASCSGKVEEIANFLACNGSVAPHIVIKTDKRQETADISPIHTEGRADFLMALRNSGIIDPSEGLYPLSYKFNTVPGSIDTLLVNGAECDSYLTADHMTMMTYSADILSGIHIIMRALAIPSCIIAISDNKPDAISLFNKHISDLYINDITVQEVPTAYPIGEENSIVYAAAGRLIPVGKRAQDVGIVTCNVSCILKFKQYLDSGMPLVSKAITLDGDAVAKPLNIEVPIGTLAGDVIKLCRGTAKPVRKIVFGGPLYGIAIPYEDVSTDKLVCGIIVYSDEAAKVNPETSCIRCGKCVRACPIGLMPITLADAYENGDMATLRKMNVTQCVGCYACSYVCPARRQLGFHILQAKSEVEKEAGENGQ